MQYYYSGTPPKYHPVNGHLIIMTIVFQAAFAVNMTISS